MHTAAAPFRPLPVMIAHLTSAASPAMRRRYLVVVAVSFVVRLLALYFARHAPLASDAQDYSDVARQLVSGQPFVPYWPPGVPLFLAPFIAAGAGPVLLRASTLIFWGILCWGFYRLMQALQVAGIAWLVLLIFSVLPDSIQMAIEPMTQMPTAALLIVALSAAVKTLRGEGPGEYLLLGGSLGLTALTRPSTLPLLVLLPLLCALPGRRFASALAGCALGLCLFGAWMLHARSMTGRWVVNTANAENLYFGNNPWTPLYRTWYFGSHAKPGSPDSAQFPEYVATLDQVDQLPALDRPAAFQQLTQTYIRRNFGTFLLRTSNRIRCYFGFDTFTAAALSNIRGSIPWWRIVLLLSAVTYLLIVGTAILWIAQAPSAFWRDPATWALLGTMALYAAPYWISMSHPTYHFPLILPLAAVGAVGWRLRETRQPIRPRAWLAVAALLLIQVEWVFQMATGRG